MQKGSTLSRLKLDGYKKTQQFTQEFYYA